MIAFKPYDARAGRENAERPVGSAEEWLGRNASGKQRLWRLLNPRHRRSLQLVARALVLHQRKGRLPDAAQGGLAGLTGDFERLARRAEELLAQAALVARQRE